MHPHQQALTFVSVLAFLGTVFVLAVCIVAVAIGAIGRFWKATRIAASLCGLILFAYGIVLLGFSLASRESTLMPGAEKYFCEIDCHIAYAVTQASIISPADAELEPLRRTQIVLVRLRTRFDPTTISPRRGNAPLTPNPRRVFLVDSAGGHYAPSPNQARILASLRLSSTSLATPLRPGESYLSDLVFETASKAQGLRLAVTSSAPEESLLWDDENAPLHKKTYFALPPLRDSLRQ